MRVCKTLCLPFYSGELPWICLVQAVDDDLVRLVDGDVEGRHLDHGRICVREKENMLRKNGLRNSAHFKYREINKLAPKISLGPMTEEAKKSKITLRDESPNCWKTKQNKVYLCKTKFLLFRQHFSFLFLPFFVNSRRSLSNGGSHTSIFLASLFFPFLLFFK